MTNREAFEYWLQMKVRQQMRIYENMSDEEFIRYIRKYPGTEIHANLMEYYSAYRFTGSGVNARNNDIGNEVEWLRRKVD